MGLSRVSVPTVKSCALAAYACVCAFTKRGTEKDIKREFKLNSTYKGMRA